jgi:hypothetical protein
VIEHGTRRTWAFISGPEIHHDSNLTIECLHRVLVEKRKDGPLPKILYLQMDNCGRDNKNRYVLSYLCSLVARKIFDKIELAFLPVGHTHEVSLRVDDDSSAYLAVVEFFVLFFCLCLGY